jgi:hypothetical protein
MLWSGKTSMIVNVQKLDKRKTSEILLLCTQPEAQNVGFYHSEESYDQQSSRSTHKIPIYININLFPFYLQILILISIITHIYSFITLRSPALQHWFFYF